MLFEEIPYLFVFCYFSYDFISPVSVLEITKEQENVTCGVVGRKTKKIIE